MARIVVIEPVGAAIDGIDVAAPVEYRESVAVLRLSQHETDAFLVQTTAGEYVASQVVIATGGYQVAVAPRLAERFPQDIHQLHSSEYRKAADLPAGDVLVVGSGQSGCQIAEDLHLSVKTVETYQGHLKDKLGLKNARELVQYAIQSAMRD